MTTDQAAGGHTALTPEEIGEAYDDYGDFYGMVLGDSAIHMGMWVAHGERDAPVNLVDLADLAQDRQTDYLIDTLRPRSGDHMLDVGCGTGGPAIRAAQRTGARVTGVTVSRSQVAESAERIGAAGAGDLVEVAYGNAMDLSYADATFTCAWAIDSFPHLSDRAAGLGEVSRVLQAGGLFLLTDIALRGTPSDDELASYTGIWSAPPPRPLTELVGEIGRAGFDIVRLVDMTPSARMSGEVMALLYRDRRDEIEARFGELTVSWLDDRMPPYRSLVRDHLDYVLLLLRKRG